MAAYVTSERAQRRAPFGAISLAAVALFSITACGKLGLGGSSDEMSWARAALERNDRIEVVAADSATSTFTVRIKETGDLRMVRADQVIAGPPGAPVSSTGMPAGPAAAPAGSATLPDSSQTAAAGAAASAGANSSMASAGQSAAGQSAASPAQDGSRTAESASNAPPAGSQSMMRQSNAAASAPRTGYQPDSAPAAEVPNPNSDVASITPGGRTLESGPGYAIKTASKGAPATATARVERERSSTTSSAVERRHDPIVCQGDRFLQIDNRNLEFDGDAVTAEDGCEIHITNSHITAKGVGIFARSANVHIDNSQIEGDSASIDASDGAQVYVSSSRFKGISRRVDSSAFHDLGGNVWN